MLLTGFKKFSITADSNQQIVYILRIGNYPHRHYRESVEMIIWITHFYNELTFHIIY